VRAGAAFSIVRPAVLKAGRSIHLPRAHIRLIYQLGGVVRKADWDCRRLFSLLQGLSHSLNPRVYRPRLI
jgi:hypothetical protein